MAVLRVRELINQYRPGKEPMNILRETTLAYATIVRLLTAQDERFRVTAGPRLGTLQAFAEYLGVDVAALVVSPDRLPDLVRDVLLHEQREVRDRALTRLKQVIAELEQTGA